MQLELRIVDLQSIVRAAIDSTREASERKGLVLHLDFTPETVVRDPARVQQVFNNLRADAAGYRCGGAVR